MVDCRRTAWCFQIIAVFVMAVLSGCAGSGGGSEPEPLDPPRERCSAI